jgi:Ca2+-binding RTX toxin-like protein
MAGSARTPCTAAAATPNYGEDGSDLVFGEGGKGCDVLQRDNGNDEIYGDAGDDILWAGSLGDVLDGRTGDDKLNCDKGRDTLIGGKGANKMAGRDGNDTYFVGTCEREGNRIAQSVDDGVDLGRQPSSGTPNGLFKPPFCALLHYADTPGQWWHQSSCTHCHCHKTSVGKYVLKRHYRTNAASACEPLSNRQIAMEDRAMGDPHDSDTKQPQ